MFWLILFSPAIAYAAILGLSELGLLGVSQATLRLHLVTASMLQALLLFGGVIYEGGILRSFRRPVPRYLYYLIGTMLLLCILSAVFLHFG
jgi:hypothetical protein